jgi:hypothetical protein
VVPVLFQVIVVTPLLVLVVPLPPELAVSLQPETVPTPLEFDENPVQVTTGVVADATPEKATTDPTELTANIAAIAATREVRRSM